MKTGTAWSVRGVDEETREAVLEAARQSGLSVGDWLRSVLADDRAGAHGGDEPADAGGAPDDALRRLESRLGRIERASRDAFDALTSRLEKVAAPSAPDTRSGSSNVREMVASLARELDATDENARSQVEGKWSNQPAGETDEAEYAIRELERRILGADAEPRPARGAEAKLADISDRLNALLAAKPARKPERDIDSTLRGLESRIDAARARLGQRPAAAPARNDTDRLAGVEAKLADLAQRVAGTGTKREPAEPAELAERPDRDPVALAVADITERQRELDRRSEVDGAALSAALAALRNDVAGLMDQIGAANLTAAEGNGGYYELARRIDALSAREPLTESQLESLRTDLHAILESFIRDARNERARLDALGGEVSELRRLLQGRSEPEALARLEAQVAELGRAVETALSAPAPEEDSVQPHFDRLEARIDALSRGVEGLIMRTESPAALDELKADIAAIRSDLARPADTGPLEEQIRELAGRIDDVAARDDSAALDELETQVTRIAGELERGSVARDTLGRVEQSLAEMQTQLSGSEQSSAEAARLAALEAVRELSAREAELGAETELVRDLKRDLEDLRIAAARPDEETRSTLDSVNRTIAQVADRLARLEEDSARAATGSAGEPAVPRASVTASATPDAPPETDDAAAADKDPRARRADFIAAARRAAQAAAAESKTATGRPHRNRSDDVDDGDDGDERGQGEGPFRRIARAIGGAKKPMLLAAAAVVIAIGAMQIFGDIDTTGDDLIERTGAADTAAAFRETAAAPAIAPLPGSTVPALVAPASQPPDDLAFAPALPVESRFTRQAPVQPAAFSPQETSPAGAIERGVGSDDLIAAAQAGDAIAAYEIAARYAEGIRVGKDMEKARLWYGLAAEGGLAVAQYRFGSLNERGIGGSRNLTAAADWYQRAADQGNVNAMHNLAVLMSEGVDGPPDHAKALQWFTAAANHGIRDSQYNLGVLYARGIGPEQDLVESYKWFAVAASAGDRDAGDRRDEVADLLSPEDLALARAAAQGWSRKAPLAEANAVPSSWSDTSMVGAADQKSLVRKIQTLLAGLGYDPGPSDGVVGPRTREAVIAFQLENGIEMTGRIDGNLLAALAPGTN